YVSEKLNEKRIPFDEMKFYSTPRRLVLLIEGLPERQEDLEKEVKGPSKKIAIDEEGNPTKALEGFMKGQGVALEDISTREYNNVEYIFANKIEKGRSVEEILKDSMPDMIKSISFPKSMKWGGKNLRFARPIRWLLSLFNDRVLEFN